MPTADVAVIGVPDAVRGRNTRACVVLKPGSVLREKLKAQRL